MKNLNKLISKKNSSSRTGSIKTISTSEAIHIPKKNIQSAELIENFGMKGDAHAGSEKQVSLLSFEKFDLIRALVPDIKPGDFAENITTEGIDLELLELGDIVEIGDAIKLEVTHLGKICHDDGCTIKIKVGKCILPQYGIFGRVICGGVFNVGDRIKI